MNDSSTIKMVVVSQKRKSERSGAGVKRTETAIKNNNNKKRPQMNVTTHT